MLTAHPSPFQTLGQTPHSFMPRVCLLPPSAEKVSVYKKFHLFKPNYKLAILFSLSPKNRVGKKKVLEACRLQSLRTLILCQLYASSSFFFRLLFI